ncbi:MAG: type II secretion system F family protein, partial [Planktomarina sp.]
LGAGENPPLYQTIMWVLGPGLVGYLAPRYWIAHKTAERIQNFTNGFPDALDMMLICVEAGQSLDQSIMRVAKELRTSFPVIAEEFELVSYEIRAGKDKNDVFKEMAVRVNVHDVNSFVTVLVQSQTFGTSISDAMRMYANEMRDKRVMRAEEKANTLPTKMSLATMVLTVPPLMMILIGPSIYRVVQTLSNGVF